MIAEMQDVVNKVPSKFYADLLFDASTTNSILKSASDEAVSILPRSSGYVFRIWNNEQWYEIAKHDFSALKIEIDSLLEKVESKDKIFLAEYPKNSIDTKIPMKKDILKISIDEKLEKVREFFNLVKKSDERVINPRIVYQDNLLERILVNTEGSTLKQIIPRTRAMIGPVVKDGNNIHMDYHIVNKEAGFEVIESITAETIEKIVKSSIDLANAPSAPSGAMPVILDSSMAGLIAHESMGHGLEADQVIRDRSYLKVHYQKKVANENVNISDDPTHPGAVGTYAFDDEGIIPKKTPIIENGIFTHYLHSRLTASILGEEPRGNGRRESFMHPVYPRMSNTYFEPGDFSMDEILEGISDGVMLIKGSFGMEDPLAGGMQVTSHKGYLIKNGEKAGLVKGIALSGSVLEFLGNIDAISNMKLKLEGGTCGKGTEDYVPVTDGGTWLRSQKGFVSPG